jgi:WD40 repeat protein
MRDHTAAVNDVAFNTDGKYFATASDDGTARVWLTRTGRLVRNLSGAQGGARAVVFGRRGHLIAVACGDGVVLVYGEPGALPSAKK